MTTERTLRLLVALDSAGPNEGALRMLSKMETSGSGAPRTLDITCLFVEDEDLLRAAALPGLREISLSGQATALDPARIAREVAAQADAARRAFEALAGDLAREHAELRHRFEVARGRLAEEFDRAAAGSDLVMVTRALRSSGLRPRQGRSFLALVRQPKPVLFVNEPWDSGSSVVVLGGSATAIDTAARVARGEGLRLVVAQPAGSAPVEVPNGATVRQVEAWNEQGIASVCLAEDARLLVAPAAVEVDWAELLVSLMDRLPCSVLKLAE